MPFKPILAGDLVPLTKGVLVEAYKFAVAFGNYSESYCKGEPVGTLGWTQFLCK